MSTTGRSKKPDSLPQQVERFAEKFGQAFDAIDISEATGMTTKQARESIRILIMYGAVKKRKGSGYQRYAKFIHKNFESQIENADDYEDAEVQVNTALIEQKAHESRRKYQEGGLPAVDPILAVLMGYKNVKLF